VHDWSNASIAKDHDSDGNNAYGTAGYWQIRPTTDLIDFAESVGGGNSLGVSAGSSPTLVQVPTFLSSISGGAGTYVNFGGYPTFRGPDGSSLYRQGALSVPVTEGPYNSPAGNDASRVGVPVQFTLGAPGRFRLGLAVDSVADGSFAPDYVSVYSNSTGTVFSPALTRDGNPDMVFFDLTGEAGDVFIVGVWQNVATQHPYQIGTLSLITFDLLPDSEPPVLSYDLDNGNFVLSWPVETTGWTLESSTDLGDSDIWDPVTGVVPLIQQLQAQTEEWRQTELSKARKALAKGEPLEDVLEALSKGLTQKMLHGALAELRASDTEVRERAGEAIRQFFLRKAR
jgi:hypothetical protein